MKNTCMKNTWLKNTWLTGCAALLLSACASGGASGGAGDNNVARVSTDSPAGSKQVTAHQRSSLPPALARLAEINGADPQNGRIAARSVELSDYIYTAHAAPASYGDIDFAAHQADLDGGPDTILATLQGTPNNGGWSLVENTYYHAYSGMQCDTARFMNEENEDGSIATRFVVTLVDIRVYDDAGYDTHCHYQDESNMRFFTQYASFWPDITLEQSAGAAYGLMLDRYEIVEDSTVVVFDADTSANPSSTIEGETLAASFIVNLDAARPNMKTALWINKTGDWHIKVRATYQQDDLMSELLGAITHLIALQQVDEYINAPDSPAISNDLSI